MIRFAPYSLVPKNSIIKPANGILKIPRVSREFAATALRRIPLGDGPVFTVNGDK
jgi:hypothetical protein